MRKRDFYHTGLDISRSELAYMRQPNPSLAQDYFVDGNVAVSGDGSMEEPFSTLAEAIAASNISIGLHNNRWWARRNRIFVMGDTLTEDLTQLPTKCDVIGVGSYDANAQPGLYGHHSTLLEAYGTRWINMWLKGKAHASAIFTLAGATGASGQQFIDSTFDATLGTLTSAILATASPFLQVLGCRMIGTFATSYISFGAGQAGGFLIKGNKMLGTTAKGIIADAGMTASWDCLIHDNDIHATGLVIDDDSDLIYGTKNRLITDADAGADSLGACDVDQLRWFANKLTSKAGTERNADWPFPVQFAS